MRIAYLLTLLVFCLFQSCGEEQSTAETPATVAEKSARPSIVTTPADVAVPDRPAGCSYVSDAAVLRAVGLPEDQIVALQPGPSVTSCYYRLDGGRWMADLVIDVAFEAQAAFLLKEVAAAYPEDKTTVNGHDAKVLNDNRILKVAASPPYTIKFSALPKVGEFEPKSSEERMAIMLALAKEIEAK